MSEKRRNRMITALAFALLLAATPTALTAGERASLRGERRLELAERIANGGLLAQAWQWLMSVWTNVSGDQGGLIDPNGNPVTDPTTTTGGTSTQTTTTTTTSGLRDPGDPLLTRGEIEPVLRIP